MKPISVTQEVGTTVPAELEKEIRAFITIVKDASPTEPSPLDSDVFFGDEREGYLFLGEEKSGKYRETARKLFEVLYKTELRSTGEVVKLFNAAILETLDINSRRGEHTFEQRLDIAVSDFKDALSNGLQTFWIYYPVLGLAPEGLPFTIGHVEFASFRSSPWKS